MISFRNNKIHSDFKLSHIKKLLFDCQSKKESAKLFFGAVINKGETDDKIQSDDSGFRPKKERLMGI